MGSVYIHTNKEDGKVYVGQTQREPWKRWRDQRNEAMRGELKCRYFQSAIRKYRWDGFDHQIVSEADLQDELNNLERVWIILLRATDREFGYNLTAGGEGGVPTEETRKLMSDKAKTRKRQPCTEKTKAKLSVIHTGRVMSEETRKKSSEAAKNNPEAMERCRQMGKAQKGKPWSEKRRISQEARKLSGASNVKYGAHRKGKIPWNKGLKLPEVSARMMGNTNGKYSWKNKKRKPEAPKNV